MSHLERVKNRQDFKKAAIAMFIIFLLIKVGTLGYEFGQWIKTQ
jgi:hypothetical protein